jgi:hypothetical protein
MCFSATASFTAGAGLFIIGTAAAYQSKTTPQRFLASIPLIFSVQQLSEGLLWLAMSHAQYAKWQEAAMYTFLVFAQVVWPAFVPVTLLLFEEVSWRRKLLGSLSVLGILTSVYFSWCLMSYGAAVSVENFHIKYVFDFPLSNRWFTGLPYILAAVVSPFLSSVKPLRLLGAGLLISYIITWVAYHEYLVSIWCYFAAVLSLFIIVIIWRLGKVQGFLLRSED